MAKKEALKPLKTARNPRGRPSKGDRSMGVVRLPDSLWDALTAAAQDRGLSRNALLQEILARWAARQG